MTRLLRSVLQMTLVGTFPLLLSACGDDKPAKSPAAPPAASPELAGKSPEPSPEPATSSSSTEPGAPPKKRRPYEIHNGCGDAVTIVFAEDPKSPKAGRQTLSPSSTMADGPRDADGNQTIWLVDDKGEGLVKVQVTRGMKRVEIGKSCRTLDAR